MSRVAVVAPWPADRQAPVAGIVAVHQAAANLPVIRLRDLRVS